ncbi:acyloxyacyl hydrolase [Alloprevotella sp. OH1205_COT-284]|nr:acyloxyacyl hydrolase [Alloprevotella sp. OH1205_COT-284]
MFRFMCRSCLRVALAAMATLGAEARALHFDECDVEPERFGVADWFRRPVAEVGISTGHVLAVDAYQRQWLQATPMRSVRFGLRHRTNCDETDVFAAEYGYPEWGLTLSVGDYSGVKMQKRPSPDWGQLVPVDYVSDMGTLIALYGSFSRPVLRKGGRQLGYSLESGLAYNTRPYDRNGNIDNELTGSHLLFYFGATLYAACRLDERLSLRADLAFRHVSNGALDRPNKGSNALAPELTLQYDLDEARRLASVEGRSFRPFRPFWYGKATWSVGGRTLLEEWLRTQYGLSPDDPDYRKADFRLYPTYNLQLDCMRRYHRCRASGMGLDLFYIPYVERLKTLAAVVDPAARHHPFSVGLALKHEAFYERLSFYMSLGYYLFRRTGYLQPIDETPYYERVGLRYRLSRSKGMSLGVGVKAHKTKADFAEMSIGWEF